MHCGVSHCSNAARSEHPTLLPLHSTGLGKAIKAFGIVYGLPCAPGRVMRPPGPSGSQAIYEPQCAKSIVCSEELGTVFSVT